MSTGKPAKMAPPYTNSNGTYYLASKANDGVYIQVPEEDDQIPFLTRTGAAFGPYWRVNLGSVHCVWAVRILNRASSMH